MAPPVTRKEAYRRTRADNRRRRAETREGMKRGDDRYLSARDAGPARRLVRDLVDARHNAGTFFLPAAALVFVGYVVPSATVRGFFTTLWLLTVLAVLVDSVLLGRLISRRMGERFPQGTGQKMRSLVLYGVSRSTVWRRFRAPQPTVRTGEPV